MHLLGHRLVFSHSISFFLNKIKKLTIDENNHHQQVLVTCWWYFLAHYPPCSPQHPPPPPTSPGDLLVGFPGPPSTTTSTSTTTKSQWLVGQFFWPSTHNNIHLHHQQVPVTCWSVFLAYLVMCWLGLAWLSFWRPRPSKTEHWAVLVGLGQPVLRLRLQPVGI